MNYKEIIKSKFIELYNQTPLIVQSPGRVNMIGEHTDYNEGFVLPASINKYIFLAISENNEGIYNFHSYDLNESISINPDNLEKTNKLWSYYLLGVIEQLQNLGFKEKIKGFNCIFGGDIPLGAGLSSSAALECAFTFALNHLFDLGLDNIDIVKISQKSENEFVGLQCGIMDQFISVFGKKNNVLKLDCRSLQYKYYPFDFKDVKLVLFDTNVKHSLASSEYNTRRKECNTGIEILKKFLPQINSLRDVSINDLTTYKDKLDEVVYKRCKFVIEENMRVEECCKALEDNDLITFGKLMYQGHEGLKNEYEVSCSELDILIDLAKSEKDIFGARMMGGGFGGCTINIIKNDSIQEIVTKITDKYHDLTGLKLGVYSGVIENGTSVILGDNS